MKIDKERRASVTRPMKKRTRFSTFSRNSCFLIKFFFVLRTKRKVHNLARAHTTPTVIWWAVLSVCGENFLRILHWTKTTAMDNCINFPSAPIRFFTLCDLLPSSDYGCLFKPVILNGAGPVLYFSRPKA